MTDLQSTEELIAGAASGYQPPTIRIAATYPMRTIGDVESLPDGHPDNVEIEINAPSLHDSKLDVGQFVTQVVASLFRYAAIPPAVEAHAAGHHYGITPLGNRITMTDCSGGGTWMPDTSSTWVPNNGTGEVA